MRPAPIALALALALPARAEDPTLPAMPADVPAAPAPAPAGREQVDPFARFGLAVDAGFPEGAAVSAVYRPIEQVRLFAGPAWNVVAFGLQAGVTFVPWHLGVSPLLSLEVGRYFSADAGFIAREASGVPPEIEPLLDDVSYDYAALHLGLELGTRDSFSISIRAGLARVSLDAKGRVTTQDDGSGATVTFVDPRVRGTLPSVKLGLQLWF